MRNVILFASKQHVEAAPLLNCTVAVVYAVCGCLKAVDGMCNCLESVV